MRGCDIGREDFYLTSVRHRFSQPVQGNEPTALEPGKSSVTSGAHGLPGICDLHNEAFRHRDEIGRAHSHYARSNEVTRGR